MVLTTRYRHFWPGFEPKRSLFHFLLKKTAGAEIEIVEDPDKLVDIELQSVYRNTSVSSQAFDRALMTLGRMSTFDYVEKYRHGFSKFDIPKARQSIWYTAENLRAPIDVFTSTIGFDATDSASQNTYFPFWMFRLNWDLGNELTEISPRPIDLVNKRKIELIPLEEACVFSSTRDPGRMRLISIIEQEYKVNKYGSAFGGRVTSKLSTSTGFKFQICPENSNTWGYVTEKLVEAWDCKNLAIWEGVHSNEIFNTHSYVDATGRSSQEILELLNLISNDEWVWRLEQPLMTEIPTLEPLIDHLKRVLDRI